MADITVTPANVAAGEGATTKNVVAGDVVTAGELVYKVSATGLYAKAITTSAVTAAAEGIALNSSEASGQPLTILTAGTITIGGTVVVGEVYTVTATTGGIGPHSERATAEFVSIVGIGITATTINVAINASGIAVPA